MRHYRLDATVTNWKAIVNSKRTVDIEKVNQMGRRKSVDNMAVVTETGEKVNVFGIPSDPVKAAESFKAGTIKATDGKTAGKNISTFKITVKEEDKTYYENDAQPFGFMVYDSLAGILEAEGAELTDENVEFLNAALSGDKTGEAVKAVVDTYNSSVKSNAKSAAYQAIVNQYAPMDQETKEKKIESMVKTFAALQGVSLETARTLLAPVIAAQAK